MYDRGERRERAIELLARVEMADQRDKLPTAISGGQQQRVAIARALANDPLLLVADEPTGNLDSRTAEAVFGLFEELVANGKTILMVTHDDDLASQVTRTVTIADGRIVEDSHRPKQRVIIKAYQKNPRRHAQRHHSTSYPWSLPMLDPRWMKILRDLWFNKTRTILVVASIAVGVFAVGTVQHLRTVLFTEMQAVYRQSNASNAIFFAERHGRCHARLHPPHA